MENHVLTQKQLKVLPVNWNAWKKAWEESDDPFVLNALLKCGPYLRKDYEHEMEQIYLKVAHRFYEFVVETNHGDDRPLLLRAPCAALAGRAFKILCEHSFKKKDFNHMPWRNYLYEGMFEQLISFFELDNDDGKTWSLLCSSGKYENIIRTFLSGLALFLIQLPVPSGDRGSYVSDSDKAFRAFLLPRRRYAIKILWELDELDKLLQYKLKLDENMLDAFRKIILGKEVNIPVKYKRRKEEKWVPYRRVEDILRVNPDGWMWHQTRDGEKRIKAAYLYISLIQKP